MLGQRLALNRTALRVRLGEPRQDHRLLALEIGQFVRVAVARLEREIGRGVTHLQFACRRRHSSKAQQRKPNPEEPNLCHTFLHESIESKPHGSAIVIKKPGPRRPGQPEHGVDGRCLVDAIERLLQPEDHLLSLQLSPQPDGATQEPALLLHAIVFDDPLDPYEPIARSATIKGPHAVSVRTIATASLFAIARAGNTM